MKQHLQCFYQNDSIICWGREWGNGCLLKKLWSFHKASPKRMKCFINWFARFPSRPFSTLASITFLCLWGILEKLSFLAMCCISSTSTWNVHRRGDKLSLSRSLAHARTNARLIIQSMELKLFVLFPVVVTQKQQDFHLDHSHLWLFLFWFGICSARVRDSSLSSSTGGRWCSWGSLINSSRAFISSLMDLVRAYQGFDYLPLAMQGGWLCVRVCVCLLEAAGSCADALKVFPVLACTLCVCVHGCVGCVHAHPLSEDVWPAKEAE